MVELKAVGILSILLSIINYIECGNAPPQAPTLYCTDLNPQNNVDIEQVRDILLWPEYCVSKWTLTFFSLNSLIRFLACGMVVRS